MLSDDELQRVYNDGKTEGYRLAKATHLHALRAVAAAARREAMEAEADRIKELAEMYTEADMSRSKYLLGEIEFAIRARAGEAT